MTAWRRVLSVLGANGFGQILTIAMQLMALPLFLGVWNLQQYGLWLLISAAPAYFALADVGIGTVAMNRMAMLAAQDRQDEARRVFSVALGITAASTLLLLALTLPLIWWVDIGPVRDLSTRSTLSLLVAATLLGTLTPLVDGLFRAAGRPAAGTLQIHLLRALEWGGGIAGLFLFRSMIAVAAGALAARLSGTLMIIAWTSWHFPTYRWRVALPTRFELRGLLPQAVAFLALPVGNAFILQGVSIAVAGVFGPAALAIFSSFRTLSRIPVQLLTMFSRSLWPELSRSYGAGDLATLGLLYHRSARVAALASAATCIAVYLGGPLILHFWSHDKITMDAPLLALLLLAAMAGCAWQIEQVLLSATNTHVDLALWYFLASLAVVSLAALVPRGLGMESIAALLLLFELLMVLVSRRLVVIPLRGGP